MSQPWSNGLVGATGISYAGTAAEMLLVNRHPAVKAVAPRFSLFDVYTDIAFPGGVQLAWFTGNWARLNRALDSNRLPDDVPWYARLAIKGVRPVDEDTNGVLLAAAVREHADNYDPHAWAQDVIYRDDIPRGAPGPADSFSPHALCSRHPRIRGGHLRLQRLARRRVSARRHQTLSGARPADASTHPRAVGPWRPPSDKPGRSSPTVRFDQAAELLRFFDHHLRGRANGMESEPPVHYFTMVAETWRTAERWPPPSIPWPLYLEAEGRLSPAPANVRGSDGYRGDPGTGSGTATRWRSLLGGIGAAPYPDRATRDKRLQVYTSAPLPEAVEVTGHPIVRLMVAASTPDAAVFAYLEDVDEQGRGELRHGRSAPSPPQKNGLQARRSGAPVPQRTFVRIHGQPLNPGVPVELAFDLLPTSWLFLKGHAVRLAVAAADADYFAQVPAGDLPILDVHRGGPGGSRIDLPASRASRTDIAPPPSRHNRHRTVAES